MKVVSRAQFKRLPKWNCENFVSFIPYSNSLLVIIYLCIAWYLYDCRYIIYTTHVAFIYFIYTYSQTHTIKICLYTLQVPALSTYKYIQIQKCHRGGNFLNCILSKQFLFYFFFFANQGLENRSIIITCFIYR